MQHAKFQDNRICGSGGELVDLMLNVHGKQLRSCRDGQLT